MLKKLISAVTLTIAMAASTALADPCPECLKVTPTATTTTTTTPEPTPVCTAPTTTAP